MTRRTGLSRRLAQVGALGSAAATLAEARQYIAEGHFKPGSMLPKMQAVVAFLEQGGREAIITDPAHLSLAFAGKTGTHVAVSYTHLTLPTNREV